MKEAWGSIREDLADSIHLIQAKLKDYQTMLPKVKE
jgi:hypothetical protein